MGSTIFYKYKSGHKEFSNLFECDIQWAGKEYRSVEHLYKSIKAWFFGLKEDVEAVAAEKSTWVVRGMVEDRMLCKRDLDKWHTVSYYVMVACILLKFRQHAHLRQLLACTKTAMLVEDTPNPIWGRGATNNGQNLQGKALMLVRSLLFGIPIPPGVPSYSILLLGDSMLRLLHLEDTAGVANLSVGGSKLCRVKLLLPLLATIPIVKQIYICVGTNDMDGFHCNNWRPAREGKKLQGAVEEAMSVAGDPGLQVLVVSCFQRFCDIQVQDGVLVPNAAARNVLEYNSWLERYIAKVSRPSALCYLKLEPLLADPSMFHHDLLHLNHFGLSRVGTALSFCIHYPPQTAIVDYFPGVFPL